MTTTQQIEQLLTSINPSEQLKILEKLAMKIRKANSIRINIEVYNKRSKYPRIK